MELQKNKRILGYRKVFETPKATVYKIRYSVTKPKPRMVVGFLTIPKNVQDKVPCLIWNRGGTGSYGLITKTHYPFFVKLAKWGYIVIASQYSGNGGSESVDERGGADRYDVIELRDVLKTVPRADLNKIVMLGHSRGATMAYIALSHVKWLKAVVAIAGETNLFHTNTYRLDLNQLHKKIFDNIPKELKKRSALYFASKFPKSTPILIFHGENDDKVSVTDSVDLAHKLEECHVTYRLVVYPKGDHKLSKEYPQILASAKKWFTHALSLHR